MIETKLAVVPRVVVSGMLGEKDYGVLLTDQRMIFVHERTSRLGIAAGLGGVAGGVIAERVAKRREFVYADGDPETLARIKGSIVILGSAIRHVRVKPSMNVPYAYSMRVDYEGENGKMTKFGCMLLPPQSDASRRAAEGVKHKDILKEYALSAQEAFRSALPPGIRDSFQWIK
jgi:hypothetical protein